MQVDKNLFQSLSVFFFFFLPKNKRKVSYRWNGTWNKKILLEQGIIQKMLKETETGKLINTEKLGATVNIRKLIGNVGYRMWGLEVGQFLSWKRLNWGWLLNHMVLVMWIDALRQASMCCASLSPLCGGCALKKRKRQVDLPADFMQVCPSGLAWWQSLSDSAYQMYLIPAFSIQSFIANELLRTQRK